MSAEHEHVGEVETSQRRGDVNKCPICGSQVDSEAYYCPTCHNYYCFHCRARLHDSDLQLQCGNQQCGYYGKLVCSACDEQCEEEEPPSVYMEPQDGYWPLWLLVMLVSAGVIWRFSSFLVAAGIAVLVYVLGGLLMQVLGLNLFGKERKVEHQRRKSIHTCLRCQRPAKEVNRAR